MFLKQLQDLACLTPMPLSAGLGREDMIEGTVKHRQLAFRDQPPIVTRFLCLGRHPAVDVHFPAARPNVLSLWL